MGGILLISHGCFAEGLKEAAEMLCGECPQLFTACLEVSDSPEAFADKFDSAYEKASAYGEVTVFCDLMGGTPCNVAVQKLMGKEGSRLISGMNVPMLMTFILGNEEQETILFESRNAIEDVLAFAASDIVECEE